MTSFVGRRREVDDVRSRLQQARLVTIVGPGGVGKTRLAEEVALRTSRAFRDSYQWIDLASVRNPDAFLSAAAAALGVTDQSNRYELDKIREHLANRHMLIVLDNCEHLLAATVEFAGGILEACPDIRILATSRAQLGLGGETAYELQPLSLPTADLGNRVQDLVRYESVALLLDRAHSAVTGFELTESNAKAIVQLCIQLDGIPLAIELAAVRFRSLSPEQLVQRLDNRFALLTGGDRSAMPRQQTLRALIDWSYDLSSPGERALWARLSVFPGSFDLEAAEIICGGTLVAATEVINVLDGLISKSLVHVDRTFGELRYSQLMTVREYGHELLEASGDEHEIFRNHSLYYRDRAMRYARMWFGPEQSSILTSMRVDHFNFITALDWSITEGAVTDAAELAVALRYHWIAGGNLSDGRIRLERLLDRLDESTRERGDVLWVAAWTALIQGDRPGARAHLHECAAIAEKLEDPQLQAHHDHWAGLHALFCGRTGDAIDLFTHSIATHKRLGDSAARLTGTFQLAMAQTYDGQLDSALRTCAAVVSEADRNGERWNKAYALWVSSVAHFHLGQSDEAVGAARAALQIQREFKDKICTALSIEVLAWVAEGGGELQRSAELFGAAAAVWTRLGTSVEAFGPHVEQDSMTTKRRVERHLELTSTGAVEVAHELLTIDRAVDVALGVTAHASTDQSDPQPSPLTKREHQVAVLLAKGLANKEIASDLVISKRTVDGHVERILNKLGVGSRTQVVAWLQEQKD
nr:LuxR C-terminal-related transcriptional regulator [Rhodococcus sp. (in: high G+C Gram-positive bacteria)]